MNQQKQSVLIHIKGLVQGVGFRPFVYRIATQLNLAGWVENRNDGVKIKIEGIPERIEQFMRFLNEKKPQASHIEILQTEESTLENFEKFEIIKSKNTSDEITEISPDIAVCNECLTDMKSQAHRIEYPFINCTNCGPRFSIIKDLPYDREKTTMQPFVMCHTCRTEYTDILDRRFHAQPIACNKCGPIYELISSKHCLTTEKPAASEDADGNVNHGRITDLSKIAALIAGLIDSGKIVAMKGVGGFHLACDATNDEAVARLRKLKHRESKPLAVMFKSVDHLTMYADLNDIEEKLLLSWRRPIVLLKEKSNSGISSGVGIGLSTIGSFLPYMPFHYQLFGQLKTPAIVLTSGNISDEPIVTGNEEALVKLLPISDALLIYNRDIYNRTDDSVMTVINSIGRVIRRSRGFVPNPVRLSFNAEGIIAAGAELKNTFCIGKGTQAILSQHIGDLKNLETYEYYKQTLELFKKLFRVSPVLYAGDMHPDYLSTKYLSGLAEKKIFVQHHHAHIASCMAEHGLDEKVIGVSFDGTGYGEDGHSWGSEFMVCDLAAYERVSHFAYIPAPGGDKVAVEPWRMAVAYLYSIYGESLMELNLPFLANIQAEKLKLLITALKNNINCPLTCSAGRLFDAVAALLNICCYAGFEAEGPMRMESIIMPGIAERYSYSFTDETIVSFEPMIREMIDDINNGTGKSIISAKFHNTIIYVILEVVKKIRSAYNFYKVVLSGGTFQNRYLLENAERILTESNFEVFSHSKVPTNDGGIALGQLAIAAKRRELSCV